MQERRVNSDDVQNFEDLLMQQREFFAEEEIRGAFPRLVSFVVQTEQALEAANSNNATTNSSNKNIDVSLDEAIVGSLVSRCIIIFYFFELLFIIFIIYFLNIYAYFNIYIW